MDGGGGTLPPLFVKKKMKALQITAVLLVLASCRSSRSVASAAVRSIEMTDRLESVQARRLDRVLTTETIIMKPDTATGKLAVVRRSIVKTTETVKDTVTVSTASEAEAVTETKTEKEEKTVKAKADTSLWIIPAVLVGYLVLAVLLVIYVAKLFEKWTLRH